MKIYRLIENTVFLLATHLAWFFTTYYQHRIDGSYSANDIVFDVLFTVMITWFFVIIFAKNKTLFSEGVFRLQEESPKRLLLIKWVAFIVIKCALDVVIWSFSLISVEWKYIGTGLLSAAYWLIAYAAFVRKDTAVWKNKRHFLIVGALILLAVGVGVYYDLSLINQTQLLNTKYTAASPYLIRACKNMDFCNSVKTFIVDSVILCTLVVFHMTHTESEKGEKPSNWLKTFVRCDIFLSLLLILCATKIGINQRGVLYMETYEPSCSRDYQVEGSFDLSLKDEMALYIHDEVPSVDNSYYYSETASLQKNDCKPEYFKGNGNNPTCVFTDQGHWDIDCYEFSIGERKVYLYGHYAICYYENGVTPRIIRMDSLNQCENNAIVTELCKHLVEKGNLFAFEYAGEYLAKYEPEFIQPYIEKYSSGLFNVAETRWMEEAYYRSDYIVDLAKQFS